MASLLERLRAWDIRIWASIGASILLIVGVMWTVPFTPDSTNFSFDTNRRGLSTARMIEFGHPVQGQLVDGSDTDFYRIAPTPAAMNIEVHMANGSQKLIPSLRVYDTSKNLVAEKSKDYLKSPGANLDCTFLAQPGITYYLQVLSQRNTIGPYTLTVTTSTP